MALEQFTLETITTPAGTLTVKLNAPTDLAIVAEYVPPSSFLNIGEIISRVENRTGWIESESVKIDLVEFYDYEPTGFWFNTLVKPVSSGYDLPQFEFFLNEGSGDTFLFFGVIEPESLYFTEEYINGSDIIRVAHITLVPLFNGFKELDFDNYIANVLANRAVTESPLNKVNTATPSVTAPGGASNTVKYRIAVRDMNREYVWGDEITVTSAPDSFDSSNYVDLTFTGVSGGITYILYRTYNAVAPAQIGYVTSTIGSSFRDDQSSLSGDASQTYVSARKFVAVSEFFRQALVDYFGSTYATNLLTIQTEDVKAAVSGVGLGIDTTYLLIWHNTGTLAAPNMEYVPYFNSAHSIEGNNYYLGNNLDVYRLLGYFCKLFAVYPRYYFDTSDNKSKIELLARGRFSGTLTMPTQIIESRVAADTELIPRSILAYRELNDPERYQIGEFDNTADLDMSMLWVVQSSGDVNDYEKMYKVIVDALITATECDGARFYNYAVGAEQGASGNYLFQEAWAKYYYNLTYRRRRVYRRKYYGLKCDASHSQIQITRRTTIDDGIYTKTYYANEVRKDILKNILTVEWIEQ